jgi:hypothetical protein
VEDAGSLTSLVGYNTLNKLRIGGQYEGVNGTSGTSTVGLGVSCNSHLGANYRDVVVGAQQGGPDVFPQQGQGCLPLTQSGNTFADQTGCGSPVAENIWSGVAFNYFGVAPSFNEPICRTVNVLFTGCNPGNSGNCSGINLVCNTPGCNQQNIAAMNAESDAQKKELLRNRIVAYYLAVDSPTKAITNLVAWNNASSKRRLVGVHLRTQQWANAQTALNAIGTANAEDAAFTAVYQTLIDVGTSGTGILGFTPAHRSSLTAVANGTTTLRHAAQGLLNTALGTPITLLWEDPDATSGTTTVKAMQEPKVFGDLVALPNPFDGSTTLQCAVPETAVEIRLLIADLEGRVVEDRRLAGRTARVQETLDGTGKPNGVYLCTITADGAVVGIARIVVQH